MSEYATHVTTNHAMNTTMHAGKSHLAFHAWDIFERFLRRCALNVSMKIFVDIKGERLLYLRRLNKAVKWLRSTFREGLEVALEDMIVRKLNGVVSEATVSDSKSVCVKMLEGHTSRQATPTQWCFLC